jgi:hypothetical protein
MINKLSDRIAEKARSARVRAEQAYALNSTSLTAEHMPRVVAAFGFAHLQLTIAVVVQALANEGHRVKLGRTLGVGLRVELGGRSVTVSPSALDDSKVIVDFAGDYQRRNSHCECVPPFTLSPEDLNIWASELADEVADHLLGGS